MACPPGRFSFWDGTANVSVLLDMTALEAVIFKEPEGELFTPLTYFHVGRAV